MRGHFGGDKGVARAATTCVTLPTMSDADAATDEWEDAFVAVSMVLGLEEADLASVLGHPARLPTSKNARAHHLASCLARVARDLQGGAP